jgi:hypothetical protein
MKKCTPEEAWFGRRSNMGHWRFIGSLAYLHVRKENRKELYVKGEECIFVSYTKESKAYKY